MAANPLASDERRYRGRIGVCRYFVKSDGISRALPDVHTRPEAGKERLTFTEA
jgi:hypothetical protein